MREKAKQWRVVIIGGAIFAVVLLGLLAINLRMI